MVAVKDDLALVAAAIGPFRQFGPDFGSGKPSGANLQLALDMGKYVNSFAGAEIRRGEIPGWGAPVTLTPIRWCPAAYW